jgi:hypothetical protein
MTDVTSVTRAEPQEPPKCVTPLFGEINQETLAAIAHVAEATRPPPVKPPEVSIGRFHDPRHWPVEPKPKRLGLIRRVLKWLGFGG